MLIKIDDAAVNRFVVTGSLVPGSPRRHYVSRAGDPVRAILILERGLTISKIKDHVVEAETLIEPAIEGLHPKADQGLPCLYLRISTRRSWGLAEQTLSKLLDDQAPRRGAISVGGKS